MVADATWFIRLGPGSSKRIQSADLVNATARSEVALHMVLLSPRLNNDVKANVQKIQCAVFAWCKTGIG